MTSAPAPIPHAPDQARQGRVRAATGTAAAFAHETITVATDLVAIYNGTALVLDSTTLTPGAADIHTVDGHHTSVRSSKTLTIWNHCYTSHRNH